MVRMVVGVENLFYQFLRGEVFQVAEIGRGVHQGGGKAVMDQNRIGKEKFLGISGPYELDVPKADAIFGFLDGQWLGRHFLKSDIFLYSQYENFLKTRMTHRAWDGPPNGNYTKFQEKLNPPFQGL